MTKPEKVYLGDAVYAEADDFGGIVLTTEDGIRATNRIVLEDDVIESFLDYVQVMRRAQIAVRGAVKDDTTKEIMALIESYGGTEGDHHRAWVLDQIVRVIKGRDYDDWRDAYEGPGEYVWDQGIAP